MVRRKYIVGNIMTEYTREQALQDEVAALQEMLAIVLQASGGQVTVKKEDYELLEGMGIDIFDDQPNNQIVFSLVSVAEYKKQNPGVELERDDSGQ